MSDQILKTVDWLWKSIPKLVTPVEVERVVVHEIQEMIPQAGQYFVRLAGASGALAVILGAYGAHGMIIRV